VIFLDQPVNVGFSYTDSNDGKVDTSPEAGKDVYAFLQLFLGRFWKYRRAAFHLAAESYGGTYGPNIARVIHEGNKHRPSSTLRINLESVILANGWTDPYIQMGSVADYACEGPYPIYKDPNDPECQALRKKIPTCQRLIGTCYRFESRLTCVPAALYCSSLQGPFQSMSRKISPAKYGLILTKSSGSIPMTSARNAITQQTEICATARLDGSTNG
jgi:cathepsin A (carboxypeptidase C)